MAKAAVMSFNLAIMLSLLIFISMAEGRLLAATPSTPNCFTTHGVKDGETCFSVQQEFNLTPGEFATINPNLVCDKLFVGQWLCLVGSA